MLELFIYAPRSTRLATGITLLACTLASSVLAFWRGEKASKRAPTPWRSLKIRRRKKKEGEKEDSFSQRYVLDDRMCVLQWTRSNGHHRRAVESFPSTGFGNESGTKKK